MNTLDQIKRTNTTVVAVAMEIVDQTVMKVAKKSDILDEDSLNENKGTLYATASMRIRDSIQKQVKEVY